MNETTVELLTQVLSSFLDASYQFRLRIRVLDRIAREHPEALPDYERFLEEGRQNQGVQRSHDQIAGVLEALRKALAQG
jgi:hypothetical protein